MNTATRASIYAVVVGAIFVGIYYLATNVVLFPNYDAYASAWNPITAIILAVIGLVAGVAWGSRGELSDWKTVDVILTANLAVVFGLLFLGWAFVWDAVAFLNTLLPGLRDLFYGFWFIAAIVAPYIVRRPGAALAAETLAALAELLAGGEWGLTLLISGLVQGGLAEVVFAGTGYKRYDLLTLMIAGAAAGVGSLVVDRVFWYPDLTLGVLGVMLVARIISGALLSGWLGKWLVDAIADAGALNSFAIGQESRELV